MVESLPFFVIARHDSAEAISKVLPSIETAMSDGDGLGRLVEGE